MSARSPIGRPVVGRPRRSQTIGSLEDRDAVQTPTRRSRRNSSAYSEENVTSIPQVPPIPDRFRPRRERNDLTPDQSSLEEPKGKEPADRKADAAPHALYLPNCSIGKPKEVQVVSNAMMQAYIAMRGNYLGGQAGDDPLFSWIQQREELPQTSRPKIHGSRDVSRMLHLIDKALDASNMGGDSPRDCVFEVYRPDFNHIQPPQDMDMSTHIFASSCNDFEWEDDSDDDEADVPSGRISPCTFLEWSKDCVRWNADDMEIKQDTTAYRRMRPPTPRNPEPPRRHEHVPRNRVQAQWDIQTGEELTPTYYVPNSPSIIYTPPGINFAGFQTPNFHMQYRRMAPLVERDLRTRVYNGPNVAPPGSSDGGRDCFTASEVEAATTVLPEVHNIRGAEVSSILREQYAAIQQAEEAERALYRHAELQREHIARLQFDQRHLNEFLPALHMRREMRDREQERRREERIRGYVVDHALDTQTRLDMAWFRLTSTQARVQENVHRIAGLEHELRGLCESTGVRDPEHAYAVLMGAASEGSSRGSLYGGSVYGNNRGGRRGAGGGGGGTGAAQPFGPWSPSSLGRAEEEFDRLAAGMRMRGSGGDPRIGQRRWDDEASRDSGVAGVGNRGQNPLWPSRL